MSMLPRTLRATALASTVIAAGTLIGACGSSHPAKSSSGSASVGVAKSTAGQPGKILTIYSSQALQGPNAAKDQSVADAELLALESARGEEAGYHIRLIVMDNSTATSAGPNTATVIQDADTAAADPTTIAYLGDDTSGATEHSIPITNAAGILQVSPTATATALTLGGPGAESLARLYPTGKRTFARVVPSDAVQAEAQAAYQSGEGCASTFIIDDGGVYGEDLAGGVAEAVTAGGGSVVGRMRVSTTSTDFGALDAKVTSSGADCVFYGGEDNANTVALWRNLSGLNTGLKLFGPDALATTQFAAELPTSVQAQTFLTSPGLAPNAYSDLGQEFYETYEDRFGGEPDPEAIFGYEAMSAVLQAIKEAGPGHATRAAVVREFFKISNRTSVLGTYSIDANGDSTLDAYGAYVVQAGALVFNYTLTPAQAAS